MGEGTPANVRPFLKNGSSEFHRVITSDLQGGEDRLNYTKGLMEEHLRMLHPQWPPWAAAMPLRSDVKARNPMAARDALQEILEYCWTGYEKSLRSTGDLVTGRCDDLASTRTKPDPVTGKTLGGANLYERVAEVGGDKTLFDAGTQGNLLKFDKWAPVVNDSWILGGVHGQRRFRLASGLKLHNLWNGKDGYFVVTAREVLGLLNFGYKMMQIGPWQCFVCVNRVKAMAADLQKYDEIMKKRQSIQEAMTLVDGEGSSSRAAQQVQDFKNLPRRR